MRKYVERKMTRIMMAMYHTSLPDRDVQNMPMDFCWTECTSKVIGYGTALYSKEKWGCGIAWYCSQ